MFSCYLKVYFLSVCVCVCVCDFASPQHTSALSFFFRILKSALFPLFVHSFFFFFFFSTGTTRRIENWDQLTEAEKKVTWRRISQRNEKRRKQLLEQQQQQHEPAEAESAEEDREL